MATCKCPECGAEINPAAIMGGMRKKQTPAAKAARAANLEKANEARKKKAQPASEDSV